MRRGWQVMGQHRRALQHLSIDRLACEAIFPRREASQECGNGGVEIVCVEQKKWAWADGFSLVSEATKRGPPRLPTPPFPWPSPQGTSAPAPSPILRRLSRSHWIAQRLAASRSGGLGAARVKSGFIFPLLLRNLPDLTITRSALIFWVKAFELNARIIGGKLPVNPGLLHIALVLPRLRFVS
jgi:hypothetical protein